MKNRVVLEPGTVVNIILIDGKSTERATLTHPTVVECVGQTCAQDTQPKIKCGKTMCHKTEPPDRKEIDQHKCENPRSDRKHMNQDNDYKWVHDQLRSNPEYQKLLDEIRIGLGPDGMRSVCSLLDAVISLSVVERGNSVIVSGLLPDEYIVDDTLVVRLVDTRSVVGTPDVLRVKCEHGVVPAVLKWNSEDGMAGGTINILVSFNAESNCVSFSVPVGCINWATTKAIVQYKYKAEPLECAS